VLVGKIGLCRASHRTVVYLKHMAFQAGIGKISNISGRSGEFFVLSDRISVSRDPVAKFVQLLNDKGTL